MGDGWVGVEGEGMMGFCVAVDCTVGGCVIMLGLRDEDDCRYRT